MYIYVYIYTRNDGYIWYISTLLLIVYDISSWLQVYGQSFDEYSGTNAYIGQRFNGYVLGVYNHN